MIGVQAPRFDFGADRPRSRPASSASGSPSRSRSTPTRELWLDYGCEGWPSLFLWGLGGALRWFHFGEGEYRATEEAIQEELRGIDALRDPCLADGPIRPTDAPGAMVIAPTPEIFPAPNRAWTSAEDGPGLIRRLRGRGAHTRPSTERASSALELDGEALPPLQVEGAGLYELADHGAAHGTHTLRIGLGGDVGVWSISFAPASA